MFITRVDSAGLKVCVTLLFLGREVFCDLTYLVLFAS
jgi:hypothetical protein